MSRTIRAGMAPELEALPGRRSEGRKPVVAVRLRTITPIYGGGVRARMVDREDVIRVPSVRGHLRWWWRALFAGDYESPEQLFEAERRRFGGVGDRKAQRSAVEVEVEAVRETAPYQPEDPHKGKTGYVLWPARPTERERAAECRPAGLELELRVYVDPKLGPDVGAEVRDCVRAWILFGGYGGRTRRGFGSLTVADEQRAEWLPKAASPGELQKGFRRARLFEPGQHLCHEQIPRLGNAKIFAGRGSQPSTAHSAWTEAIDWLKEFRQGTRSGARVSSGGPGPRQGRSNWPEADKVRRLTSTDEPWSHRPLHDEKPAWPRAGFGLPIIGQFQRKARDGGRYHEPPDYWLKWMDAKAGVRERLASPLILKAMALADGSFVPIALWLDRAYPEDGKVVLGFGKRAPLIESAAPFERLRAHGDSCLSLLEGHSSLRDAFFAWLPQYRAGRGSEPRRSGHPGQRRRSRRQGGFR